MLTETIATALRNDLLTATAAITSELLSCPVEQISTIAAIVPMLGSDSLLVLDVAMADATETVGNAACGCMTGSRRRLRHLARFEALCAAHDGVRS